MEGERVVLAWTIVEPVCGMVGNLGPLPMLRNRRGFFALISFSLTPLFLSSSPLSWFPLFLPFFVSYL